MQRCNPEKGKKEKIFFFFYTYTIAHIARLHSQFFLSTDYSVNIFFRRSSPVLKPFGVKVSCVRAL